jgi:hypothetical protein
MYEIFAWVMVISTCSFMFGRLYEWRKYMKEQEKDIEKRLKGGINNG